MFTNKVDFFTNFGQIECGVNKKQCYKCISKQTWLVFNLNLCLHDPNKNVFVTIVKIQVKLQAIILVLKG